MKSDPVDNLPVIRDGNDRAGSDRMLTNYFATTVGFRQARIISRRRSRFVRHCVGFGSLVILGILMAQPFHYPVGGRG